MKLFIAGGVGEHGRNCFYVEGEKICFLVDCGIMAGTLNDRFPHLSAEQIERLKMVFLTHSHADHTGALPWLRENGYRGAVIASQETLHQLSKQPENVQALEKLCPGGAGTCGDLNIRWGRSGHCAGSVWYHFSEGGSSILFSGDYTEDALVYVCDPIRGQHADVAVLDCAYGWDTTSFAASCAQLTAAAKELQKKHGLVLFPVPKYGRGLEILKLLARQLPEISFFADDIFLRNLTDQRMGGFWYIPAEIGKTVEQYSGQPYGIVFVSDPQLKSKPAREAAEQIQALGGFAVMTGTPEQGSYSDWLLKQGKMKLLQYPVHLNYAQFQHLVHENRFERVIPYHSPDVTAEKILLRKDNQHTDKQNPAVIEA